MSTLPSLNESQIKKYILEDQNIGYSNNTSIALTPHLNSAENLSDVLKRKVIKIVSNNDVNDIKIQENNLVVQKIKDFEANEKLSKIQYRNNNDFKENISREMRHLKSSSYIERNNEKEKEKETIPSINNNSKNITTKEYFLDAEQDKNYGENQHSTHISIVEKDFNNNDYSNNNLVRSVKDQFLINNFSESSNNIEIEKFYNENKYEKNKKTKKTIETDLEKDESKEKKIGIINQDNINNNKVSDDDSDNNYIKYNKEINDREINSLKKKNTNLEIKNENHQAFQSNLENPNYCTGNFNNNDVNHNIKFENEDENENDDVNDEYNQHLSKYIEGEISKLEQISSTAKVPDKHITFINNEEKINCSPLLSPPNSEKAIIDEFNKKNPNNNMDIPGRKKEKITKEGNLPLEDINLDFLKNNNLIVIKNDNESALMEKSNNNNEGKNFEFKEKTKTDSKKYKKKIEIDNIINKTTVNSNTDIQRLNYRLLSNAIKPFLLNEQQSYNKSLSHKLITKNKTKFKNDKEKKDIINNENTGENTNNYHNYNNNRPVNFIKKNTKGKLDTFPEEKAHLIHKTNHYSSDNNINFSSYNKNTKDIKTKTNNKIAKETRPKIKSLTTKPSPIDSFSNNDAIVIKMDNLGEMQENKQALTKNTKSKLISLPSIKKDKKIKTNNTNKDQNINNKKAFANSYNYHTDIDLIISNEEENFGDLDVNIGDEFSPINKPLEMTNEMLISSGTNESINNKLQMGFDNSNSVKAENAHIESGNSNETNNNSNSNYLRSKLNREEIQDKNNNQNQSKNERYILMKNEEKEIGKGKSLKTKSKGGIEKSKNEKDKNKLNSNINNEEKQAKIKAANNNIVQNNYSNNNNNNNNNNNLIKIIGTSSMEDEGPNFVKKSTNPIMQTKDNELKFTHNKISDLNSNQQNKKNYIEINKEIVKNKVFLKNNTTTKESKLFNPLEKPNDKFYVQANNEYGKHDKDRIIFEAVHLNNLKAPCINDTFNERTAKDLEQRQQKQNLIKEYLQQQTPKIPLTKQINTFNRLITDANRRLVNFELREEQEEKLKVRNKKVDPVEWDDIYNKRFLLHFKNKLKVVEILQENKALELKQFEDNIINDVYCNYKLPESKILDCCNRLYNDASKRNIELESKRLQKQANDLLKEEEIRNWNYLQHSKDSLSFYNTTGEINRENSKKNNKLLPKNYQTKITKNASNYILTPNTENNINSNSNDIIGISQDIQNSPNNKEEVINKINNTNSKSALNPKFNENTDNYDKIYDCDGTPPKNIFCNIDKNNIETIKEEDELASKDFKNESIRQIKTSNRLSEGRTSVSIQNDEKILEESGNLKSKDKMNKLSQMKKFTRETQNKSSFSQKKEGSLRGRMAFSSKGVNSNNNSIEIRKLANSYYKKKLTLDNSLNRNYHSKSQLSNRNVNTSRISNIDNNRKKEKHNIIFKNDFQRKFYQESNEPNVKYFPQNTSVSNTIRKNQIKLKKGGSNDENIDSIKIKPMKKYLNFNLMCSPNYNISGSRIKEICKKNFSNNSLYVNNALDNSRKETLDLEDLNTEHSQNQKLLSKVQINYPKENILMNNTNNTNNIPCNNTSNNASKNEILEALEVPFKHFEPNKLKEEDMLQSKNFKSENKGAKFFKDSINNNIIKENRSIKNASKEADITKNDDNSEVKHTKSFKVNAILEKQICKKPSINNKLDKQSNNNIMSIAMHLDKKSNYKKIVVTKDHDARLLIDELFQKIS